MAQDTLDHHHWERYFEQQAEFRRQHVEMNEKLKSANARNKEALDRILTNLESDMSNEVKVPKEIARMQKELKEAKSVYKEALKAGIQYYKDQNASLKAQLEQERGLKCKTLWWRKRNEMCLVDSMRSFSDLRWQHLEC